MLKKTIYSNIRLSQCIYRKWYIQAENKNWSFSDGNGTAR